MEGCRRFYKKNPGSGTEGYLNQLHLSTLYLSRLAGTGKAFEFGVEVAAAWKFDDIVMHLTDEDAFCLVQAKHKQDESKRITLDDFLKTNSEYSLPKYFESFQALQSNAFWAGDNKLQHLVIYTNLNIDDSVMPLVREIPAEDTFSEMLNVNCNRKRSRLYRFDEHCEEFIEQLIDRISMYGEVARKLSEQLIQRKKISINPNGVFYEFHALLVRDVFDLDKQVFRADFVSGMNLSKDVMKFRWMLERTLRIQLKMDSFDMTDLNVFITNGKLKLLFEPGFINKSTDQPSTKSWCSYRVDVMEIKNFFRHLTLAVDQPNFIELEAITKEEVYGLHESVDDYMRLVFERMDHWIRVGDGYYLTRSDWLEICAYAQMRITGKKWLVKSEDYQKRNPANSVIFIRNSLLPPLEHFLQQTTNDTFLVTAPFKPEVTAARVLQGLSTLGAKFVAFEANYFEDLEDLESIVPFVKNLTDEIIVMACNEECSGTLIKNIRYKLSAAKAKMILVTHCYYDCLADIRLHHQDHFKMEELNNESRKRLLERDVVIQSRKVALQDLLSPETAESVLDTEFICQILMNREHPIQFMFKYQRQLCGEYFPRTLVSEQQTFTEHEFEKALQNHRVVILSDVPGMGKTTFLQCLIDRLNEMLPDHITFLIHLKFYTESLETLAQLDTELLNAEALGTHLQKCFFTATNRLAGELFKNALMNTGKLIFLIDGYDSVIERYKASACKGIKLLLDNCFRFRNMIIATRPHEIRHLQLELPDAKVFSFQPFDVPQRIEFLTRWWHCEDELEAISLLDDLSCRYGDWIIGVPFQMKLLAQIYQEDGSDRTTVSSFGGLIEAYLEKQFKESNHRAIQITGIGQQSMAAQTLKQATHADHCNLAARLTFFPMRPVTSIRFRYLLDIGLIVLENDQFRFSHHIFQYYFAAESLMQGKFIAPTERELRELLDADRNRFLRDFLLYHLGQTKNLRFRERFCYVF